MIRKAKVVNVIVVESDTDQMYFTLDGTPIGGYRAGAPVLSSPPQKVGKQVSGAVVTPPSPKQARIQDERKNEKVVNEIIGRSDEND